MAVLGRPARRDVYTSPITLLLSSYSVAARSRHHSAPVTVYRLSRAIPESKRRLPPSFESYFEIPPLKWLHIRHHGPGQAGGQAVGM